MEKRFIGYTYEFDLTSPTYLRWMGKIDSSSGSEDISGLDCALYISFNENKLGDLVLVHIAILMIEATSPMCPL